MNNHKPTICLGIPTINRKDLLDEALEVYMNTFKNRHIYIVDNGSQGFENKPPQLMCYTPPQNLGVAGSWNAIVERQALLGYTHMLIPNDDVIITKTAIELEDWLHENPADFYTANGSYCAFIIPYATYVKIGAFDTLFYPAYYEDNDYTYRLQLAGCRKLDSEFLLPEVLRFSKSGEKDKSLYDKVFLCRRYYEDKWGGAPSQETYKTPHNQ
jgi:GT2 family glycosyltransferase